MFNLLLIETSREMETLDDFQKCCESKVIATNQSFLLRGNCPRFILMLVLTLYCNFSFPGKMYCLQGSLFTKKGKKKEYYNKSIWLTLKQETLLQIYCELKT